MIRRWLARTWHSYGGGYYGLVAAGTFLVLEWIDLVEDVAAAGGVREFIRSELFSFGLASLGNAIQAAIWPVLWLTSLSYGQVALVGGTSYVAYRLVRPFLDRALPKPPEEGEENALAEGEENAAEGGKGTALKAGEDRPLASDEVEKTG